MFPIWVIVELFTLGMLSFFFADLNTQDQKDLARAVFHSTANNIKSWLRCCTDLRNICAHYGRLYFTMTRMIRFLPAFKINSPSASASFIVMSA